MNKYIPLLKENIRLMIRNNKNYQMSLVFSRILKSEVLKNEVDDITKNDEIEHKIVYDTRYCKQSV